MNSVGGNAVHRNPTGAQRWALASVLPLALAGCGGGSSNGDSTQADWFGTPILTDLGSAPRAIGFGDFNRDGRLDVAFTLATGALYVALCNGGDGSFVAPIAYVAAGPASTDAARIALPPTASVSWDGETRTA